MATGIKAKNTQCCLRELSVILLNGVCGIDVITYRVGEASTNLSLTSEAKSIPNLSAPIAAEIKTLRVIAADMAKKL